MLFSHCLGLQAVIIATQRCLAVLLCCLIAVLHIVASILWANKWWRWRYTPVRSADRLQYLGLGSQNYDKIHSCIKSLFHK